MLLILGSTEGIAAFFVTTCARPLTHGRHLCTYSAAEGERERAAKSSYTLIKVFLHHQILQHIVSIVPAAEPHGALKRL